MKIQEMIEDINKELFPRSIYLFGSVAEGDDKELSDVDLIVCFYKVTASFDNKIKTYFEFLSKKYAKRFDCRVIDLSNPLPMPYENCTAKLIFGDDVMVGLPYESFEEYKARNFNISCTVIGELHHETGGRLFFPLSYPNRNASYFGFIENGNCRRLLSCNLYMARFLLAHLKKAKTVTKAEDVHLYKQLIHDEWTEHLVSAFALLSEKYRYCIPERGVDTRDHFEIKKICRHTLQFEN
jgi:predicted nucleotidyltransferase